MASAQDSIGAPAASVEPTSPDETEGYDTTEITVTGSRIARDGFQAPTPVSVVSSDDIEAQAPANLADFVNQLPSIVGSSTPAGSTGNLSSGTAGINAINLRNLGLARTLVLLDGQRSVASTAGGAVDVNTFPQELVERVEVVTGGASAAYGSDAVGGVINFILNKDFKGLKGSAEYGISDYGDGRNYKFTLTGGASFLDDRLHILLSGEYNNTDGIHTVDRAWNRNGNFHIVNPNYVRGNGEPERIRGTGIGPSLVTPGGLITAGPLRGLYFGPIDPATGLATTGLLNFGTVSGQWMIGGDWEYTSSNYVGINSILPGQERLNGFGRIDYDLTPDINIFGQFSYARDEGYSVYIQSINAGNLTIRADNAFLPASVSQQLAANGLTSFQMGTSNFGIPPGTATNVREAYRYVGGAKGGFTLFDNKWDWDFYYQKGYTKLNEKLIYTWDNAKIANATDAVAALAGNVGGYAVGTIVCRINVDANPANDDRNCVPINRIGIGGVTQAALDYVLGEPYRNQTVKLDVASLSFSGSLFDLPAGPVSMAFGGEWSRDQVNGYVPDGSEPGEPNYTTGWQYGNYLPTVGRTDVIEGFIELAVPVFEGFELNGAFRHTYYKNVGPQGRNSFSVDTWKVGASYQIIDDLRLRATLSHDIRAPNLDELFAAGTGRSNTVTINGVSTPYQQFATGNFQLQPEVADTWTAGAIFTPSFVPGLSVSADYYKVKINDAIGQINPQTIADLCYIEGNQQQCDNISTLPTAPGVPPLLQIRLAPFNFAQQIAEGLDLEASYRADVGPGKLTFRAMATHYIKNLIDNGIDLPNDTAGTNATFGPPSWVYRLSALYNVEPFTLSLTGRGISSGKFDNNFIECQTNCPISTVSNRTINDNHIDGIFYVDASMMYEFDVGRGGTGQLQFSVKNLFNKDPVLFGRGPDGVSSPSFPQTNFIGFYETVGRTYRFTARFSF